MIDKLNAGQVIAQKIRDNFAFALEHSLINCHAVGLDSVVFERAPHGGLRRLFIAHADLHTLWRNAFLFHNAPWPQYVLSIAVHSHHCDLLELRCLSGCLANQRFKATDNFVSGYPWERYRYHSPIGSDDPGKFEKLNHASLYSDCNEILFPGDKVQMIASELHTVYVPQGNSAIWLIEEGDEDPNYKPICYSNDNLEHFDFEPLYQPMDGMTLSNITTKLDALR